MDTYQYKYGDRPLEGYTIQRAAGRGGFGEVYYAVSDSGRQVAIKAILNYEQIELRGITQCMNLKSAHLVTIFDVKYNDLGRLFVVMEYVSGPSLSDMLRESPGGLGTPKTAFFLREIAKGLSFLHDCGIVHRDLKPGNIFYENGYVKIGDYGLTKAISASHDITHTTVVGTAQYMAPEIGTGQYDRSVDIYALGVVLYEMLTGQPPFLGSNAREVHMKHMTVDPDLGELKGYGTLSGRGSGAASLLSSTQRGPQELDLLVDLGQELSVLGSVLPGLFVSLDFLVLQNTLCDSHMERGLPYDPRSILCCMVTDIAEKAGSFRISASRQMRSSWADTS